MKNSTLFLLLCFLIYFNASYSQKWEWISPKPTGGNLTDVCMVDSLTAYIVGYNGTILKTINGGSNWKPLFTGTTMSFSSIHFFDIDTGYILSYAGDLLKTTNGGNNWTYLNTPFINGSTRNIFFTDRSTGYVSNWAGGSIAKTIDGGKTWTYFNTGITQMEALFFVNKNVGYAGGLGNKLAKTTNAGVSWQNVTINLKLDIWHIRDIYFTDENTGYAVGDYNDSVAQQLALLIKTTDGGAHWEQINIYQGTDWGGTGLISLYFKDASNGYIFGNIYNRQDGKGYNVIKTTDGGSSWTYYYQLVNEWCFEKASFFNKTAIAVGRYGILRKSTDDGHSWTNLSTKPNFTNYDICFTSESTGYIIGYPDNLKTTDGGNTWSILNNSPSGYKVFFTDSATGYIMNLDGTTNVFKTEDGGNVWNTVATQLPPCTSIFFTSSDTGYLAGNDGVIMKTTNGGNTWTLKTSGTSNRITKLDFPEKKIGFGISYDQLLKTTDAGETWEKIQTNFTSYLSIFFTSRDIGYISGYTANSVYGTTSKTTNGGLSWMELNTKNNYYYPDIYNDFTGDIFFVDDSTGYIYNMYGIIKTMDAGLNWEYLKGEPPSQYNSAWFKDKNTGFFVGEGGVIMKLNTDEEYMQRFAPDGAEWHYSYSDDNKEGYIKIYPTGDTIIQDLKFRSLQKTCVFYDNLLQKLDTLDLGKEYLREDRGNILWFKNNSINVLYDFKSSPGNTYPIPGTFPDICTNTGTMIITGKETININGQNHIELLLDSPGYSKYHLGKKAIEGIGSIDGYFFPEPTSYCSPSLAKYSWPLRCYIDSTFGYYTTNLAPYCNYTIGIEKIDYNSQFKCWPNPAKDLVVFDYSIPNGKYVLRIYDCMGILIKEIDITGGTNKIIWDANNALPGMYFYSVLQNNMNISGKIIISQ